MADKISVASILNSMSEMGSTAVKPPGQAEGQRKSDETSTIKSTEQIPSISELFSSISRPQPSSNAHQTPVSSEYGTRPTFDFSRRNESSGHYAPPVHSAYESPRLVPPIPSRHAPPPPQPKIGARAPQQPYRRTRENLPKHTTNALKQWLMTHAHNPYPTESEKKTMCDDFNLTIVQLNNWFINGRRRYLKRAPDNTTRFSPNNSLNSSMSDSMGRSAFAALKLEELKELHGHYESEGSSLENSWSSMPSLSEDKERL